MTEDVRITTNFDAGLITARDIDCSMLDGIDTPDGPVFFHRDTPADQRAQVVRAVLADRQALRQRLAMPAPTKSLWKRIFG